MAEEPKDANGDQTARAVVFTRAASRGFRRMPRNTEALIRDKLVQLAADPAALANNVKALRGGDHRYRLRVGDWRAVFTIEPDRIIVHDRATRLDLRVGGRG